MSRYSREETERASNLASKHTALGRVLIIRQLLTDQYRLADSLEVCLDVIGKPELMKLHHELLKEIRG